MNRFLVIGGAGEVGRGIVMAIKENGNNCTVIDPKINKSFEEFSGEELPTILKNIDTVIYSADIGNRDEYQHNSALSEENAIRFEAFCHIMAQYRKDLPIWYIGGSWTKRKPNEKWKICDDSQNKEIGECNPYEAAKITAEIRSQKIAEQERQYIRFVDYISIVPNMSENFSFVKMTLEAIESGNIHFSSGKVGRPLLASISAGMLLLTLIQDDERKEYFKTYLIPGVFVPFSDFASIVKKLCEQSLKKKIELIPLSSSPAFLSSTIESPLINDHNIKHLTHELYAAMEENVKNTLMRNKETIRTL